MRNFFQNRIAKQLVFGFFVFFLLLNPLSVDLNHSGNANVILNITHADTTDAIIGAIKQGFGTLWQYSGGAIFNIIGNVILGIGGFFMGIGGYLLDEALNEFVFGMGEQLNEENLGNTVNTLWTLIRDICNLAFIFGFVYVGFMTIIDSHDTNTKKMLAQIIIGALLINFSLFFVKAIIDFSNFTTYKVYLALAPEAGVNGNIGISEAISQQLGVVSLWKAQGGSVLASLFSPISFWFYVFGFILLIVAAFSFLASAILLIVRFGILILLMIGAPILFAATVFPQTKQYSEDMWKTLIGYSFYAPIYLLLILISIRLMDGVLPDRGGEYFSNVLGRGSANYDSVVELLLIFGVCIFFMVSSISIAQKMSIAGGTMAIKIGNDLRGRGQRMFGASTAGLVAATGRATIGRKLYNRGESGELQDKASRAGIRGWVARQDLKLSRAVGDASFDVRKVGGVGKELGIGEGAKGGYGTMLKEIKEKEAKFAKSFDEVDDDDPMVKRYKDRVKAIEKEIKEHNKEKSILGDSPADKARKAFLITQIEKLEEEKEENNKNAKLEKQRRVTGSAAFNTRYENANKEKKKLQEELDKLEEQQKNETDRTILDDIYRKQVATKKRIKELHKEYKKMLKSKDAGYAGALEGAGPIDSWLVGRLIVQDREAGKAIRKANVKKAKKTKEDEKHDEILEATKSSKKD